MYHGILDGVNKVAIKMLQPGTFKQDALDAFCNEAAPACQQNAVLAAHCHSARGQMPVAAGSCEPRLRMGMTTALTAHVIADPGAAPGPAPCGCTDAWSQFECGVPLYGCCETCTCAGMEAAKRIFAIMHMY